MKILKEWTTSIKKNFEQRLTNPLLGAFSVSWVLFNWKALLFLMQSNKEIEAKIGYVESNFNDISFLLYYPLISAVFITVVLPWVSYFVQSAQEFVNKKRSLKQFQYDTELLKAKKDYITIQSEIDHIKATHELELEFSRKEKEIALEKEVKHSQHELEKDHKLMENDFKERAQRHQFEMEREKRDRELEVEERRERHKLEMEREQRERELELEERRQRHQFDMEMEKNRFEKEFEDRMKKREMDVERYKADRKIPAA